MKSKIFAAAVLGTQAFKDGNNRIPCHDKKLMDLLTNIKVGDGASKMLTAWLNNWDMANLNNGRA